MPIKPENRARYPKDWKAVSLRIRVERAQGQCECTGHCGLHPGKRCEERQGQPAKWAKGKVILTVAHLDHTPEHCDPANLMAACQRCHLRYDAAQHRKNAEQTRGQRRAKAIQFPEAHHV